MYKIFLCGLDNTGKTSITNSIQKLPNPGDTTPTLNFNVAQIIIDLTEFVIFDAPGQTRFRKLWEDKLYGTEIICYVVDASTPERFELAKEVLDKTLKDNGDELTPLIICFHKLDLPNTKHNIPKARDTFKPELYESHSVQYLKTSIFNPDSIMKLKTLFIKTIEDRI